jgi:hypothetical protein
MHLMRPHIKNEPVTVVKSFVDTLTSGLCYKSFTPVIYDCNDSSGQYYKTAITILSYAPNLASAVNYDCK